MTWLTGLGANGAHGTAEPPEDDMLPIGAIFLSIDDTDPAASLGYGTWLRFAQGRILIGVDDTDPDFDAAGDTGGSKVATPAGTIQQAAFTGAALGSHTHGFTGNALGTHTHTFTGDALGNHLHTVGTIAPSAHAGAAVAAHSNHTHGVGTLDAAATSAGTPAGTNSAPTFTGAAMATHSHQLPLTGIGGTTPRTTASFGTSGGTVAGVRSLTNAASTTAVARELTQAITAGTPSGAVSAPTFTGSALATHDHTISGSTGNESASLTHSVTQPSDHTMSGSSANASAGTPAGTNASVGAGTPTGSNSSDSAGTPAGTINAQSFSGQSASILNPYFAVYMFRRTA